MEARCRDVEAQAVHAEAEREAAVRGAELGNKEARSTAL